MILAPDTISTPVVTSQGSQDTPDFSPTAADPSYSHRIQAGKANRVLSGKERATGLDPIVINDPPLELAATYQEWRASGVNDDITAANVEWLAGQEFIERILGHRLEQLGAHAQQYATAEYSRLVERHQGSVDEGGWFCTSQDLSELITAAQNISQTLDLGDVEWQYITRKIARLPRTEWGCFKSAAPRQGWKQDKDGHWVETDKPLKYEHPHGVPTQAFFLEQQRHPRFWLEVLANAAQWPMIIVEGAKKAGCLLSLGYVAVAVPGITQWNQPKTRKLINELAIFARKGREVYICFDQDEKATTRRYVRTQIFKLAAALRRRQCCVKIINWKPSLGKGVDDFVAAHGPEAFSARYNAAVVFEYWAIKHFSELSYEANWVCPKGQRYLDGIPFPDDATFICIKAPKGTGKTEEIRRLIEAAHERGQAVLLISHRIQLTQTLCDRTGIPSVYEIVKGDKDAATLAYYQGFGLCAPSLHPQSQAKFDAEDWQNALVIFDEAEQVTWEILDSATCQDHRVAILREQRNLIQAVLSPYTDGRLVLADADLSDITVEYMRGIAGEDAPVPWVAVSHYQGNAYDVTSYDSVEQLLAATEACLARGEKLLVTTDSQKRKSRVSSTALEARWKRKFPHLKTLRLDSKSLSRKNSPAYGAIAKLNALAGDYDIVIVSPSVETGVSIDITGHFDRVVGFFQGVMPENSVRQSLARLREPVPRDIYVAPRGLSFIGGGEVVASALEISQDKYVSAALRLIYDAARDDIDSNFLPVATHTWAKMAARQNAGMADYRTVVLAGLADEGHRVNRVNKPEKGSPEAAEHKALGQQLNVDKHHRQRDQGQAISQADDLSQIEVEKLEQSHTVEDEAQAQALRKAQLERKYPGVAVTPDLHILDEYGWHPKIKLHYALTMGRSFVKGRDQEKVEALIDDGAVWGADVTRATQSVKVTMLEAFDIPALLEMECISSEDERLIELAEKAFPHRREIKTALGFSISEKDSPVVIGRKFLGVVGYGLGTATRTGPRGAQVRHYPIERIDYKELADFGPTGYDGKATRYESERQPIFIEWLSQDLAKAAAVAPLKNEQLAQSDTVEIAPLATAESGMLPSVTTEKMREIEPVDSQLGKMAEAQLIQLIQLVVSADLVVSAGRDQIHRRLTTDYASSPPPKPGRVMSGTVHSVQSDCRQFELGLIAARLLTVLRSVNGRFPEGRAGWLLKTVAGFRSLHLSESAAPPRCHSHVKGRWRPRRGQYRPVIPQAP